MRARRTVRFTVWVTPSEMAVISARAAAHRLRVAAYVRATTLGVRSAAGRAADVWWAGLAEERRVQVYRWISDGGPVMPLEVDGQLAALDLEAMSP